MTDGSNGRRDTEGPRSSGFRAQLRDASLTDLVQMECYGRTRRIVRVTSEGRFGYLYFDGGRVVHAETRNGNGERAALEILNWQEGVFEPCSTRSWPSSLTIQCSAQELIMRAAVEQDHAPQNLVSFPVKSDRPPRRDSVPPATVPLPSPASRVKVAVALDAAGKLVAATGSADEFVWVVAYACRQADLLGDMLGLERMCELECSSARDRVSISVRDGEPIVAARTSSAIMDREAIKAELDL